MLESNKVKNKKEWLERILIIVNQNITVQPGIKPVNHCPIKVSDRSRFRLLALRSGTYPLDFAPVNFHNVLLLIGISWFLPLSHQDHL